MLFPTLPKAPSTAENTRRIRAAFSPTGHGRWIVGYPAARLAGSGGAPPAAINAFDQASNRVMWLSRGEPTASMIDCCIASVSASRQPRKRNPSSLRLDPDTRPRAPQPLKRRGQLLLGPPAGRGVGERLIAAVQLGEINPIHLGGLG